MIVGFKISKTKRTRLAFLSRKALHQFKISKTKSFFHWKLGLFVCMFKISKTKSRQLG